MNTQIKYTQEQLDKALMQQSNNSSAKALMEKTNNLFKTLDKFELNMNARFLLMRRLLQGLFVVVIIGIVCRVI